MTQDLLTNIGEEYFVTKNTDGVSLEIGLYRDVDDDLGETDDLSALTTEPSNGNYSRQSTTMSASNLGTNWGITNDSKVEFDFSDTTDKKDVDTAIVIANFDSVEAGSLDDHLISNPALTQRREIGSIDVLEIKAGDLELKLD